MAGDANLGPDRRLLAALRHAPDRDLSPPVTLDDRLRRAALDAIARAPAADSTPWWQRWLAALTQPVAGAALATLVLGTTITLMWHDEPPTSSTPTGTAASPEMSALPGARANDSPALRDAAPRAQSAEARSASPAPTPAPARHQPSAAVTAAATSAAPPAAPPAEPAAAAEAQTPLLIPVPFPASPTDAARQREPAPPGGAAQADEPLRPKIARPRPHDIMPPPPAVTQRRDTEPAGRALSPDAPRRAAAAASVSIPEPALAPAPAVIGGIAAESQTRGGAAAKAAAAAVGPANPTSPTSAVSPTTLAKPADPADAAREQAPADLVRALAASSPPPASVLGALAVLSQRADVAPAWASQWVRVPAVPVRGDALVRDEQGALIGHLRVVGGRLLWMPAAARGEGLQLQLDEGRLATLRQAAEAGERR